MTGVAYSALSFLMLGTETPSMEKATKENHHGNHELSFQANPPWRNGSHERNGGGATTIALGAREKELSYGTRRVLKSMMHASKLSASQQRHLDSLLDSRTPLPATPQAGMSLRPTDPSCLDLHIGYTPPAPSKRAPVPVRGRRPQIRTLGTIAASDAFEIDMWRPSVQKNYSVEKHRLQRLMATHGAPAVDVSPAAEGELWSDDEVPGRRRKGRRAAAPKREEEIDEFDMLMNEISDRKKWLDDMTAMGKAQPHKRQIQSEIALRINMLEKIDKERSGA
ncbi:uncharacterized protein EV422DRAFT_218559 [Fimicolochytrium jonesii]|uniref:uncharacterized protein n=1 Tax=Fimicolochytrium jonesii TaxID=1396493 RepID=UPI0022FEC991|nr:uncharacterized protein EV422DRAFT_218559 [Fimicolochytrium jonesii]KAI8817567.1 hypothetical protein EV422DRAFT_218559 [Fimicolochytrium jonesii]